MNTAPDQSPIDNEFVDTLEDYCQAIHSLSLVLDSILFIRLSPKSFLQHWLNSKCPAICF